MNTIDISEAVSLLKSCRLMLYAWRGVQERMNWGEHPELDRTISEIEAFVAYQERINKL